MDELELWGGHECTVNRIDDRHLDQTLRGGHEHRPEDLDRFAALGIKALRYPVLWERVAPGPPGRYDWRWTDERLSRLRELGVRPIAGLVHHGSGPAYTDLLDDGFASGLAGFAAAAAERYPWISDWTPVNEPLTTARFSCLYGHWYPHRTDERAFWLALLNQVDATRLAMAAIRKVIPGARLIQTEDLGRTYATGPVVGQARFDNDRRWMTWDLLFGRVTPDHPLHDRLCGLGFADRLAAIADAPCPPEVVGVNHYLTSDRFLDHGIEAYPPEKRGGNGALAFADVEAVRVLQPAPQGLDGALREAWTRYGVPLAVTELHNGCTREDQARWLLEGWRAAQALREEGISVEAVTAWSLTGSLDWNSLLTREDGHYECGVFDTRGSGLRPTLSARLLQDLAAGVEPAHPALANPGWWRRDARLSYRPVSRTVHDPEPRRALRTPMGPNAPILITGATGTLGKALARACAKRALDYALTDRRGLDLADAASIQAAIERIKPWAVINAAGWVRVDDAEADAAGCRAANADGVARLAEACDRVGLPLVSYSSDLVFDGAAHRPYVETDAPNPINAYGRSKAEAEALLAGREALMIRTSAFFSPYDPYNFAAHVVRTLAAGRAVEAAADLTISPTYVPDLADASLDLLLDGESGLWHLANPGAVSWAEFAILIARRLGLDEHRVLPLPASHFAWPARRPANVPLSSERGVLLPPLEHAIDRYARTLIDADFAPEAVPCPDDIGADAVQAAG